MAIDMNADIGEVIKSIFSKDKSKSASGDSGPENPYLKLIITGTIVVISIVLYVIFVFIPAQEEIKIKQGQVDQIEQLRVEIQTVNEEIISATKELALAKAQYEKLTKLFHTDQELEDLYRHISMLALTHNLLVSKLEKAGEEPVFEMVIDQTQSMNGVEEFDDVNNYDDGMVDDMSMGEDPMMGSEGEATPKKKVAYFRFRVKFDITGNYSRYTLFRRDLAKLEKIINIDKETIIVLSSEKQEGKVKVSATLSTYRLPAEGEEYMNDDLQNEELM